MIHCPCPVVLRSHRAWLRRKRPVQCVSRKNILYAEQSDRAVFVDALLAMSGNAEMLRVPGNVNARVRFVRWIDMNRGSYTCMFMMSE